MILKLLAFTAALTLAAAPALAHSGTGVSLGFFTGLLHPMSGLDHILAMSTVGLLAAFLGGSALWAVPASFIATMVAGAAIGLAQPGFPAIEFGVTASVVVFGALIAMGWPLSLGGAMMLSGLFAVFHGYAHIAEMPNEIRILPYSLGFVCGTMILQGMGTAMGLVAADRGKVIRVTGATVAIAGLVLAIA